MRQLHCFILLINISVLIITLYLFLTVNKFINYIDVNPIEIRLIADQPMDNYTRCLLDMNQALNSLSIPWFITYGTALMFWRSKNFVSNDIDIGVFYSDFEKRNYNESYFLSIMKKRFKFKSLHDYGRIDHGKEWRFSCPKSGIGIDIFLFYSFNETNSSFAYWTASYNGLCNKVIYKKCRWGFPDFKLTKFEISGSIIQIVPKDFIIERYGKDYMIPKEYDYLESLKILPNLIPDYTHQIKHVKSRKRQRF